jgi:uncharacterized damage-inducible protein DinB
MTEDRKRPGLQASELDMLNGWLEHHRAILLWKCDGLTDGQLRQRSVPPSSMSLLGLIRHMTDVERGWFQQVLLGEDAPDLYTAPGERDGDFNGVDEADVAAAFSAFEAECDASRRAVAAAADLDVLSKEPSERTGEQFSLRWIVTHMIEEYARHNGHADLLRETIDGTTGYY